MPYRPINDQVLIEHDAAEGTIGDKKLILAPDRTQEQERANEGTVVAVGPGKWGRTFRLERIHTAGYEHGHGQPEEVPVRLPMGVKPGDRVTWGPYTAIGTPPGFLGNDVRGTDFEGDDQRDFVLVAEHDLLAVIEEA